MALYNDIVLDYFRNPRNVGYIDNPSGVGEVKNDTCGDIIKIYLKIKNDIIEDVKFETFGCVSAIASSSITTELIKGRTVCNALTLTNEDIIEALGGLPENKLHCSVLVQNALQMALDDYYSKDPEKYIDDEILCKCNHKCCCKNKGCQMC